MLAWAKLDSLAIKKQTVKPNTGFLLAFGHQIRKYVCLRNAKLPLITTHNKSPSSMLRDYRAKLEDAHKEPVKNSAICQSDKQLWHFSLYFGVKNSGSALTLPFAHQRNSWTPIYFGNPRLRLLNLATRTAACELITDSAASNRPPNCCLQSVYSTGGLACHEKKSELTTVDSRRKINL